MKDLNCLTEQDMTLLYYGEDPDCMSLLEAHRHLKACPACQLRHQQLANALNAFPENTPQLDPHHATRLAAQVVDRLPHRRRRFALPAVVSGIAAAVVVFSFTVWQPVSQVVMHNTATHPVSLSEQTPPPDAELLENLDLLREFDTLTELTGV